MDRAPVTVVIPVRNGEPFIGEALQSVLDQTWLPQEVIVIDDGSTDRTLQEVARFPDVICLRQPPLGLAEARNHGVRRASMPYLAFLDADDIWTADKTEHQLKFLLANPKVDIVSGQMFNFRRSETGEMVQLTAPTAVNLPGLMLMRRSAFGKVGPFSPELAVGEAIEWWARATEMGVRTESIPSVFLLRRIHHDNLGRSMDRPMQYYLRILYDIVKRRRAQP